MHGGRFGFGPIYFQHGGGGPHALAWATFGLVLLLVLALGAMVIARAAARSRPFPAWGPPSGGRRFRMQRGFDPLQVLQIRYARGELSRDEFLQATSDLASSAPTEERPAPPG